MYDPTFLMILTVLIVMVGLAYYFVTMRKKSEKVLVLERLKPGTSVLVEADYYRSKDAKEMTIRLKDGRKFLIPEEKTGTFESVTYKGKNRKLWGLENGQIAHFSKKLSDVPAILLDHQTVTAVNTRTSAKRLASPKLPKSDLYLYLIMGVIVGVALGWVIYPQFNHPAPVIEYFRQLPNGTFVPFGK